MQRNPPLRNEAFLKDNKPTKQRALTFIEKIAKPKKRKEKNKFSGFTFSIDAFQQRGQNSGGEERAEGVRFVNVTVKRGLSNLQNKLVHAPE